MTASILNGLFCCNLAFDSEALHYYYYYLFYRQVHT